VFHEVSPMADPQTVTLLNARGYQPVELTSVLYRVLGGPEREDGQDTPEGRAQGEKAGTVTVRHAGPDDAETYARAAAEGWREFGFDEFIHEMALVYARLRYAAARGCDLALMGALPGSGSQRNAERNGFRIAYTRIKWQKR